MRCILPHPSRSSGRVGARERKIGRRRTGDDRETACAIASMPSARSCAKNRCGLPMPGDRMHARCPRRPRRSPSPRAHRRDETCRRRASSRNAWPCRAHARGIVGAVHNDRVDRRRARDGARAAARRAAASRCRSRAPVDHRDLDVARQAIVLQAVVGEDHVAVGMAPRAARGPRRRGRVPTATGKPARASSSGSSPDLAPDRRRARPARGDDRSASPPVAAADDARSPAALRQRRASAATSGVLPLPPTVMLPTTMTGTGNRCAAHHTGAIERAPQRGHEPRTPPPRRSAASAA